MSQFGAEKFTTRSRAAIETAQVAATTAGNTATEPIHLLVALLRDAEGTAGNLVTKAGVEPRTLLTQAESLMAAGRPVAGPSPLSPATLVSRENFFPTLLQLALPAPALMCTTQA